MKKFIPIFAMLLLTLSSIVIAQTLSYESGEAIGAPFWDSFKQRLNFYDRFVSDKSSKQFLTTVNGALCSTAPDYEMNTIVDTDKICWINKNGGSPGGTGKEHIGVAYQVHHSWGTASGDNRAYMLKELFIKPGQQGCVAIPTKGDIYYRSAYFCDDEPDKLPLYALFL